jgi:DNA repair exonuclease SbcCD nuclease subunit
MTPYTTERAMKNPSAILTSDWHMEEGAPVCRTDDYQQALWDKISFISSLREKYKAPIINTGDLFHHWKPSPALIRKAIATIPHHMVCIPGQHDLPQHNVDLINRSGYGVLMEAGVIENIEHTLLSKGFTITAAPYGSLPKLPRENHPHVALVHTLVLDPEKRVRFDCCGG